MPEKSVPAGSFLPLDMSVIWHLNELFWKHFTLWEQTYGEHYESSLPSGVSESHKADFIIKSAKKFIVLLENLAKAGELPEIIYILEEGPGTGLYAQKFLDYLKEYSRKNNRPFYDKTRYLLYDTSEEILTASLKNLGLHKKRVKTVTSLADYYGKVLFVRHSNVWDQLPAKLFSSQNSQLRELYVQPVLDQKFESELKAANSSFSAQRIATALKDKTIESLILREPQIWKPLARNLFLKTSYRLVPKSDKELKQYEEVLSQLKELHAGQEFVFNVGVLKNTKQLLELADWASGGYIEILDVIVPGAEGFEVPRRPKKFDGSLGLAINGLMLQVFLKQHNKHLAFEKIKGLNHTATIREPSLKNLLQSNCFVTIAEIAASKSQSKDEILHNANNLLRQNIDIVAFSDQALVKSEYFKLAELAHLDVFQGLPAGKAMPVLKARTKTKGEVDDLIKNLQTQKIKNLFVVTGDPSGDANDTQQTSLDVLPTVAPYFFSGAVAHPRVDDIPNMLAKIKAGAQFFIMQATYDHNEWQEWVAAIKKNKIHEKAPLIAVSMPVVSKMMLEVVQNIKDVSVPESFIVKFDDLTKDEVRTKGLELAKSSIMAYQQSGIFSGIYIYSKSPQVIIELNNFIRTNSYLQT